MNVLEILQNFLNCIDIHILGNFGRYTNSPVFSNLFESYRRQYSECHFYASFEFIITVNNFHNDNRRNTLFEHLSFNRFQIAWLICLQDIQQIYLFSKLRRKVARTPRILGSSLLNYYNNNLVSFVIIFFSSVRVHTQLHRKITIVGMVLMIIINQCRQVRSE